jgi:bacillithiol system protein YtxJ
MEKFHSTSHLSEILERSEKEPVIIFKYSKTCRSSLILKENLEDEIANNKILHPIYLVVVQDRPELSRKIEAFFEIKHESPQIIIINNSKVTYTANHHYIKIHNFVYSIEA